MSDEHNCIDMADSQSSTPRSSAMNPSNEANEPGDTDLTIEEFDAFLVKDFAFPSSFSIKEITEEISDEEREATWSVIEEFLHDADPTANGQEEDPSMSMQEESTTSITEEAEDDDPFSTIELDPYISHLGENNHPETIVTPPTLLTLQVSFGNGSDDIKPLMDLYIAVDDDDGDGGLQGPTPPKRSRHG